MAEAIGLVASILSILHLTVAVASYLRSVAAAPESLRILDTEITALHTVLTALHDFAESHPSALLQHGIEAPLAELVRDLKDLKQKFAAAAGKQEEDVDATPGSRFGGTGTLARRGI